jgi:hypothetical protein
VGGDHDKLRNTFVGRKAIKNRVHPPLIGVLEEGGDGGLLAE